MESGIPITPFSGADPVTFIVVTVLFLGVAVLQVGVVRTRDPNRGTAVLPIVALPGFVSPFPPETFSVPPP